MQGLDDTHDPARRSWVQSASQHNDFPIQNLPFGIFSPSGGGPRCGIAIGDEILDLVAVNASGLLHGVAHKACEACSGATLNLFLAMGAEPRQALREAVSDLLREGAPERHDLLHDATACTMHMPADVRDYTDFYAGIHHARNAGKLFRPDDPLLPNYKHLPIGYHGRASSLLPSGSAIRRPQGQTKQAGEAPVFGPSQRLDFELELGIWIGPGNALGEPIAIGDAAAHIAGYALLNDWSARDIQSWEYRPLGPFLGKSFATTVSPWIVTPEALAPFRRPQAPRPDGDPKPLSYLWDEADQSSGALDLVLKVFLITPKLRAQHLPPHLLCSVNAQNLYWTPGQMLTHHTSNGCNLRAGDLFGSGTVSAADPGGFGSLLEITEGGCSSITLESGETRGFLEDGDEIIFQARTAAENFASIGFGECRGCIAGAIASV
jgi:fumarylacetoacetase